MPYWRMFYHFIWTTKKREPLLTPEIELRVHGLMRKEAQKMLAPLFYVNGTSDHVHILTSFRPALAPAAFVQQLKGSSSHFISHTLERAFEWQVGYGVLTVSEKDAPRVIQYIKNQKQHHAKGTLIAELEKTNLDEIEDSDAT